MKTKFYLAKSNRSNPDDVSRVRQILSKYPNDIEIVEFKGGSYNHKDLLSCDILVIVPDLTKFDYEDDNYIDIGRGLHEQIFAFQKNHPNKSDILVVFDVTDEWVSITTIESIDVADEDDYVNFSTIIIDQEEGGELDSLLNNRFVSYYSNTVDKIKDNELMYLLIKK